MKHTKKYILIIGMLLIQVYAPLVVYGTEVRSVETEGKIGFTGVYETPGTPEPAPEVEVKPSFPKEIAQSPSEVREHKRLPQTNERQINSWKMLGILLIVVTLSFWFWNHKKKKTNKESRI
ncbi:LPXTG cell wall anchor domain-containing protein [Enterococcus mundtii]|uniref:Cell wall protein n=1 Tax=Enterococcus mundtii TaxID=53346 RepID=A0A1V2UMA0_ENTMU|nr:LPXTG cell wall anchor domain-containing protein [Enterococcus mundtii]ONN44223.1 cell wall protein [Enterococcus mundtii]